MWKTVPSHSNYQVSDTGEVRNVKTNRVLKSSNHRGYRIIKLSSKGKRTSFKVHRLVAEAYLPNFTKHCVVDHINRVKDDNSVSNLRCVTQYTNCSNKIGNVGVVEHIIQLYQEGYTPAKIYSTLKL